MTLINLSANTVNAQVKFYGNDGSPMSLRLAFPQSGSSAITSTLPVTVGPNDSVVIQTDSSASSISEGWADIQATGALSGYSTAALNLPGVPELAASVPLDSRLLSSLLMPFDNTRGYQTAIAVANQSSTSQTITMTLLDQNGVQLDTSQINLPAFGHSSFFLSGKVSKSVNQLGIMQVQSAGGVTGIGLLFSPTASFTSIPIIR